MSLLSLWTRVTSSMQHVFQPGQLVLDTSEKKPEQDEDIIHIPTVQRALLLHGPHQEYRLLCEHSVPVISAEHELLVRVRAVGLNPIDWKAPDFNFGMPYLPYISGRDFCGQVVRAPQRPSRIKLGDWVTAVSTDYRDSRKAAYQENVVVADYNAARLPCSVSVEAGATLGVAFVAAALVLGICFGVDFSGVFHGPDFLDTLQRLEADSLPGDVRDECLNGIDREERARSGDWLVIWGGSSTTANLITQLAKLAGLRVMCVTNLVRHGFHIYSSATATAERQQHKPDVYIDSHDPDRAIQIIRTITQDSLRFAVDTRGGETATVLLRALGPCPGGRINEAAGDQPSHQTHGHERYTSHLSGLNGLPENNSTAGVRCHTVPIKVFHEIPQIGEALMRWLEVLLQSGTLVAPDVVGVNEGFEGVNDGLQRMRRGEVSWGRFVVKIP